RCSLAQLALFVFVWERHLVRVGSYGQTEGLEARHQQQLLAVRAVNGHPDGRGLQLNDPATCRACSDKRCSSEALDGVSDHESYPFPGPRPVRVVLRAEASL